MRELLRKYATDLEAQRSGLLYYRIALPTSQHVTFDFILRHTLHFLCSSTYSIVLCTSFPRACSCFHLFSISSLPSIRPFPQIPHLQRLRPALRPPPTLRHPLRLLLIQNRDPDARALVACTEARAGVHEHVRRRDQPRPGDVLRPV
jgi:hypothetical protein